MAFNGELPTHRELRHTDDKEYGQAVAWESFFDEAKRWNPKELFSREVPPSLWLQYNREAKSEADLASQVLDIVHAMSAMTGLQFFSEPESSSPSSASSKSSYEAQSGQEASKWPHFDIHCSTGGLLPRDAFVIKVRNKGFIPEAESLINLANACSVPSNCEQSSNSGDQSCSGDVFRANARAVLTQLNTCLSRVFPKMIGYGVISTLFQFWFVKRTPGQENESLAQLAISPPLHYRSRDPTLLRALGYLCHLSIEELKQQLRGQYLPAGLAQYICESETLAGEEQKEAGRQAKAQKRKRDSPAKGRKSNARSTKGRKRSNSTGPTNSALVVWYQSLGHGRCGDVLLADSPNGPVAVKCVPSSSSKLVSELQHEACVYKSLRHLQGDAIPRLFHAGPLLGGSRYGLCLEMVGVNLARALRSGADRELLKQGALQALDKLHAAKFVHRDIRKENVCYMDSTQRVCLVDLGFARAMEHGGEMQQERNAMQQLFEID